MSKLREWKHQPEVGHGRLEGPLHLPLPPQLVEPVTLPSSKQMGVSHKHGPQCLVFDLYDNLSLFYHILGDILQ